MALPERLYFTLNEITERWGATYQDTFVCDMRLKNTGGGRGFELTIYFMYSTENLPLRELGRGKDKFLWNYPESILAEN